MDTKCPIFSIASSCAGGDDLKVNQDLLFVDIVSDRRTDEGGDITVIPESYDFSGR